MIRPSSNDDLLSIVNAWYPDLEPLVDKLIETFARVNQLTGFHYGLNLPSNSNGRFSLRDLLKWCRRIVNLGFVFGGNLSACMCSSIYHEVPRRSTLADLLNMKRADLDSHAELKWLLDTCNVDHSLLIFIDEIDLSYYDLFGSLKLVFLNGDNLPEKQEDCSCCTVIAEKFAHNSPEILAGRGFSRLLSKVVWRG